MVVSQIGRYVREYPERERLHEDREITLAVVAKNPNLLEYACDELKDDKEIVLAAVGAGGNCFRFASERLRGDEEIALSAVARFYGNYSFVLPPASESRAVVMKVAALGNEGLTLLPPRFLRDREVAKAAVARNPLSLAYFSEEVRADREIALAAVRADRKAVNLLSDDAFADREIFAAAVKSKGDSVSPNVLFNESPYGLFREINARGLAVSPGTQNLSLIDLDRDKLLMILPVLTGIPTRKEELFRACVERDDREALALLIGKKVLSPAKAFPYISVASAGGKRRVLPLLLRYAGRERLLAGKEDDPRKKLLTAVRRKSRKAIDELFAAGERYAEDREMISAAASVDGRVLLLLKDSPLRRDGEIVSLCIGSYVVKNSDPPLLSRISDVALDGVSAALACRKDGRNFDYLPEKWKGDPLVLSAMQRGNDR